MCLFLFLLLCWAVVGRRGDPNLVRDNSRFGRFNSRLGRHEFPVRAATGIRWQGLDSTPFFTAQTAVLRAKTIKFPSEREKPGTLPLSAVHPWHGAGTPAAVFVAPERSPAVA